MEVGFDGVDDVVGGYAGGPIEFSKHCTGGIFLVGADEPAGRVGHEEKQSELKDGGHGAESNHRPPSVAEFREEPANRVGDDLASRDEGDRHCDDTTSYVAGGEFGEVQRHDQTRSADGKAHETPSHNHLPDVMRHGLPNGADGEEDIGTEDDLLAAKSVGKHSSKWTCYEGEERRAGGDQALLHRL